MVKKLQYEKGERDMIVLRHEFITEEEAGRRQKITSTLIDFGTPGGASAMARTVGLPAAAGTRLILEGKVQKKGVCIPVYEEIYKPILDELKSYGIVFLEKKKRLQ
jgi:saccharopine dehydrogenase-like NADP-dependent oxidoreductase